MSCSYLTREGGRIKGLASAEKLQYQIALNVLVSLSLEVKNIESVALNQNYGEFFLLVYTIGGPLVDELVRLTSLVYSLQWVL
jgi:hypothetical protein